MWGVHHRHWPGLLTSTWVTWSGVVLINDIGDLAFDDDDDDMAVVVIAYDMASWWLWSLSWMWCDMVTILFAVMMWCGRRYCHHQCGVMWQSSLLLLMLEDGAGAVRWHAQDHAASCCQWIPLCRSEGVWIMGLWMRAMWHWRLNVNEQVHGGSSWFWPVQGRNRSEEVLTCSATHLIILPLFSTTTHTLSILFQSLPTFLEERSSMWGDNLRSSPVDPNSYNMVRLPDILCK